jgi:hypothetical protein
MQGMSDEYHRLALCSKSQNRILEQCLSNVRVDCAQRIVKELRVSLRDEWTYNDVGIVVESSGDVDPLFLSLWSALNRDSDVPPDKLTP